jgi:iron uptake system EfeUOB component EfeO/EfeM
MCELAEALALMYWMLLKNNVVNLYRNRCRHLAFCLQVILHQNKIFSNQLLQIKGVLKTHQCCKENNQVHSATLEVSQHSQEMCELAQALAPMHWISMENNVVNLYRNRCHQLTFCLQVILHQNKIFSNQLLQIKGVLKTHQCCKKNIQVHSATLEVSKHFQEMCELAKALALMHWKLMENNVVNLYRNWCCHLVFCIQAILQQNNILTNQLLQLRVCWQPTHIARKILGFTVPLLLYHNILNKCANWPKH